MTSRRQSGRGNIYSEQVPPPPPPIGPAKLVPTLVKPHPRMDLHPSKVPVGVARPRPPVPLPGSPVDVPRPPVDVPRPPMDVPRPPVDVPLEVEDDYSIVSSPPQLPQKRRTKVGGQVGKFISSPMLLPEFITQYSKQLPVQIKVTVGYCGPSSRLTISTGDTFNVHLAKRAEVVHITDAHNTVYSVPLNSSIEFGLVYDPVEGSRGSSEAITGFKLRVSDMMVLDNLPKVLCCLKEWRSADGSLVLNEMEQVVVKGVQRSRVKSKRGLKVFSLYSKLDLLLPEDCHALFSTEASLVRMMLMDIVQYISDPFPRGAKITFGAEIYQNEATSKRAREVPSVLLSQMVNVSEILVETSLIASAVVDTKASYVEGYSVEELTQMIDIPLEGGLLEVQVAVIEVDETEQLYEDTRCIYEKYSPHKVKPVRDVMCDKAAAAQSLFSTLLLSGMETHGIELDEPTYKYVTFSAHKQPSASSENLCGSKGCVGDRSSLAGSRQSISGSGRSLSGSRQSLVSTGSVREERQLTSAAPRLPPREGAKNDDAQGSAGNDRHSDPTNRLSKPFHTLPHNFRAKRKEPQHEDTEAPPTQPRPQSGTPPTQPRPPLINNKGVAVSTEKNTPSDPPARNVPSPSQNPPFPSSQNAPSPSTQNPPSPSSQNPPSPSSQNLPSRGLLRRNRKDDSLLDGSMSSCDELSGEDGVSRELGTSAQEALNRKISALEQRLAAMEGHLQALRKAEEGQEVKRNREAQDVNARLKGLEEKLANVSQHTSGNPSHLAPPQTTPTTRDDDWCGSSVEDNKTYLKRLNFHHVQQLLQAMDLSKYIELFKSEQISGDILLELTEQDLKVDLGIESRLHRIRLMKVINCQHSAADILSGIDS